MDWSTSVRSSFCENPKIEGLVTVTVTALGVKKPDQTGLPNTTWTQRRRVLEVNGSMLIPTFEIVIDSWVVLCSTAFHSDQLGLPSPCLYHLRLRGYQHLHILSLSYDV